MYDMTRVSGNGYYDANDNEPDRHAAREALSKRRHTFTTDECLSADKIILWHPLKGIIGIFTMINILVTEENIVNDFLIQFPCRRVIYLGQNLSIIKETCPNGQVSFFMSCKRDYYSSTAACAAARRAIGTRNGEQLT